MTKPNLRPLGRIERKTDRQDAVVGALRERIVLGHWAPGERLPNRLEIESSFAASSITVQSALDRLKHEGFIVASRRSGTYVAENPPHLSHFALVFPSGPGNLQWNSFWAAICREAKKLEAEGERRFPLYFGVDGHEDVEDYQNLIRAVEQRRLAGIIFGNNPDVLQHTPLFGEVRTPAVTIALNSKVPWLPVVRPVPGSFMERAVVCLAEQGCKKIAVLKTTDSGNDFESALARHGLITRPWWVQNISLWQPDTARDVAHLLMNPDQTERPDGLVITDDNLLTPASEGLAAAGVPDRFPLEIVAHCNFPWPTASVVPVHRIGFDVTQIVASCINLVEVQRREAAYAIDNPILAVTEPECREHYVRPIA